jgi:lipopolysaccharide export LptBFGC system permease protein LptF
MNRGLGDLTLLYHWPPVMGALAPTLVLILFSGWLLTRVG